MSDYNKLYSAKASPPLVQMIRTYWRTRRYLFLIPAVLLFWTFFLFISHLTSYDDPEFTLEKTIQEDESQLLSTYERNPTPYKPIILNALPPQGDAYKWPPNIRRPLCMPKIFVYADNIKMGEFQMTLSLKEGKMSTSSPSSMESFYRSEQILLEQLRDKTSSIYKSYVTENPEEADFFFIPFQGAKYLTDCWNSKGIKAGAGAIQEQEDCDVDRKYAEQMMDYIQKDNPYWNRSQGRDHIMIHPMEKASLYYKRTSDRMQNAIFLTTVGDKRTDPFINGRRFRRYGDIVIPASTALLNQGGKGSMAGAGVNPADHLTADGFSKTGAKRDILMIFGGDYENVNPTDDYSGGIRSLLFNGLDQQPDYSFSSRGWSSSEYINLLKRSRYGFAPQGGTTLDTPQIWDYIAFGVVPVVVADGIIEPFEDDMDWDSFIVRIPREEAHRVDLILRSISEQEYEQKRKMVWEHGRQALLTEDAWHLIVRALCRKGDLEDKQTIDRERHVPLNRDITV
ncbi:hypothetical protein BX616_004562 [Lobosporangium transversale]|uniref:Exostosin family-domain-containing protein n=1 Tax=Lobosporangium transversale TaxID=64571 RepID=A0A1Y2GBU8_9FUNG|nr:exostosin family-domain-containing protein [Lobosporangium transversale]KAF9916125.1 hypothetical protein BX616_004562 [Lobosporangium transversale]ORZ06576.1 exostosin family-domain-containing protein [Lobosporangium transversale]|eukprot:XP_021877619.1 exostosin family-domain-containing protein [Lobosporangium transversale]